MEFNDSIPSVTIVICTHNRPALLKRCLQSLQKLTYPKFSICIIDNAPATNAAKLLAADFGVDYCIAPIRGLSRARNIGAQRATGHIIAYFDDDMIAHPNWLSMLVSEFTDEKVIAATGPMLPELLEQESDARIKLALEESAWGSVRFNLTRDSYQWIERSNFGGIGDGNVAFRRDAFSRNYLFDERLGRGAAINSGEEHYAYFKLLRIGYRIAYTPRAIVFHPTCKLGKLEKSRQISETAAYATFLSLNHPQLLGRILLFFVQAAVGRRRSWRGATMADDVRLPFHKLIGSYLAGVWTACRTWAGN